jgi:hypothetical protein
LYYPQIKVSSMWTLPLLLRETKFWQDHLTVKVMLKVLFSWQGSLHHEFIPEGSTISKEMV